MNCIEQKEGYFDFMDGEDKSIYLSVEYEENLSKDIKSKGGVYYTDHILASYMTKKALEIYIKSIDKFDLDDLRRIKILDPSCGSGAFIISAFRELLILHRKYDKDFDFDRSSSYILENSLYGVDISKEALEIIEKRIKLISPNTNISLNLYNDDFLIDFEEKDFNLIIGNPPYIGEKNNKDLFHKVKETEFGKLNYEKGMDYFYYFIEKSIDIIDDGGIISFITTNYWIKADYGKKLRNKIRKMASFREIIDFNGFKVFKHAMGQHNMIFYLEKSSKRQVFKHKKILNTKGKLQKILMDIEEERDIELRYCDGNYVFDENECFLFTNNNIIGIIDKIKGIKDYNLGDICNINQGLVSGGDRLTAQNMKYIDEKKIKSNKMRKGDGIFVISTEELLEKNFSLEEMKLVKKLYKNSNINRYYPNSETDLNLIYIQKSIDIDNYPNIKKHMIKYKGILEKRREVKTGIIPWYSIHWERNKKIFESEKIVVPQRAYKNIFAYSDEYFYASADVYYITDLRHISYKYILAILNSNLMYFWLYHKGKKKGEYLELYQRPLLKIPIVLGSLENIKQVEGICSELIEMVKVNKVVLNRKYNLSDLNIDETKSECDLIRVRYSRLKGELDRLIYQIYGLEKEEINIIEKNKDICF